MDVKVIRNQESFAPHLQAFKQECLYNKKPLPVRDETSSSQHFQPTLCIKDKPALIKKETHQENMPHEGQLIDRYHSDMMLSLARRANNKVFASNFLQGSAHFVKNNVLGFEENSDSLNSKTNVKCLPLNSKLSVHAEQSDINAVKKISIHANERNDKTDSQKSVMPLVGKAEIHTKVKGCGRKSRKLRSKSGKKKRGKSALKKRKSHKSNETAPKDIILPVKKRLDSCFSLYASQSNKEKSNEHSSYKNLPDKLKSAGFLDIRTSGSKTSHGFRERTYLLPPQHNKSNKLNLPPTTIPRKKHPKSAKNESNHQTSSAPTNSSSAPLIVPLILRDIKSMQISKEIVSLPPAPICTKSPINPVQVASSGEAQQRKNLLTKAYSGEGTLPVKLSFNGKFKRDHSLGERLSLIHSYGSAYQTVTKQLEMQHKKEQALQHHLFRAAERMNREKKKSEQRKKVYALNKLMTKLEQEKFEDFMASLNPANPSDETEP